MSPRTGRPRTGHTPNVSLRINPDAYHAARIGEVTARKTVGQWIEEAIREKIEREKEAGNVTRALLRSWGSAPRTCLTCSMGRDRGGRICTSDTWELLTLLLTVM